MTRRTSIPQAVRDEIAHRYKAGATIDEAAAAAGVAYGTAYRELSGRNILRPRGPRPKADPRNRGKGGIDPRLAAAAFLSVKETADVLRITVESVHRIVLDGTLPAVRLGPVSPGTGNPRITRIPESFVLDLVETCDEQAAEATMRRLAAANPELALKVLAEVDRT